MIFEREEKIVEVCRWQAKHQASGKQIADGPQLLHDLGERHDMSRQRGTGMSANGKTACTDCGAAKEAAGAQAEGREDGCRAA